MAGSGLFAFRLLSGQTRLSAGEALNVRFRPFADGPVTGLQVDALIARFGRGSGSRPPDTNYISHNVA